MKGRTLDDKPEGEDPAVGDSASPDGEHKMPDGKTIVVEDGVITEIRDAEDNSGDDDDDDNDDETAKALADANNRIAELEAVHIQLQTELLLQTNATVFLLQ